ncbi:MAG: hypothetical protein ACPIG7_08525 [Akkermansiaceae bacterium]
MEGLGFVRKYPKLLRSTNEVSDKRKNLSFVARVVRALGDSKPKWWKRLLAAVLALLILLGCGKIAGKLNSVSIDLVRSVWWEEATATLLDSHGQTAIRYSYEVGDETFSGNQFSFGDISGELMEAEIAQFIENQNLAGEFTVFVNPDAAGEAVILRSLTPNAWMLIPLFLVLLALGIAIAGYAVLPTLIYWWRGKLRRQFMLDAPGLIVSSLKDGGAGTQLLFSSMTIVYRGLWFFVWLVFWILLISLAAVGGGLLMIKLGDLRWIYVWAALASFVVVGMFIGWLIFRRAFGSQPPGLVFFLDGWRGKKSVVEDEKVSVHWMSDPDEKDNFRSCRVGLGRWQNGQSFSKWRKSHPDWRDTLVDILRGTVGAHSFDLATVGRFDGPVLLGEELHLVMIWQEWDGKVRQTSIYLGRLYAS